MQANRMAGCILNFFIEIDSIALQAADIWVGADGVDLPGGMLAGPRRQLITLKQNQIFPPKFRQMKQDRTPHNPTTNDHNLGV